MPPAGHGDHTAPMPVWDLPRPRRHREDRPRTWDEILRLSDAEVGPTVHVTRRDLRDEPAEPGRLVVAACLLGLALASLAAGAGFAVLVFAAATGSL